MKSPHIAIRLDGEHPENTTVTINGQPVGPITKLSVSMNAQSNLPVVHLEMMPLSVDLDITGNMNFSQSRAVVHDGIRKITAHPEFQARVERLQRVDRMPQWIEGSWTDLQINDVVRFRDSEGVLRVDEDVVDGANRYKEVRAYRIINLMKYGGTEAPTLDLAVHDGDLETT